MPRLKAILAGQAPTYFDALRLALATDGRIGPATFRATAAVTERRTEPGRLHGEGVWGNPLGHRFAIIIFESGLSPKDWFLTHGLKPEAMYRILMTGTFPRRPMIDAVDKATDGRITVAHFHNPTWPDRLPQPIAPHFTTPSPNLRIVSESRSSHQ